MIFYHKSRALSMMGRRKSQPTGFDWSTGEQTDAPFLGGIEIIPLVNWYKKALEWSQPRAVRS